MQQPPHCNRNVNTLTTCRHQQSHFKFSCLPAANALGLRHKLSYGRCKAKVGRAAPVWIRLTTAVAKMTRTIHHIVPRYISASVSTSQATLLESSDPGVPLCQQRRRRKLRSQLKLTAVELQPNRNATYGCTPTEKAQGCAARVLDSADRSHSSVNSCASCT